MHQQPKNFPLESRRGCTYRIDVTVKMHSFSHRHRFTIAPINSLTKLPSESLRNLKLFRPENKNKHITKSDWNSFVARTISPRRVLLALLGRVHRWFLQRVAKVFARWRWRRGAMSPRSWFVWILGPCRDFDVRFQLVLLYIVLHAFMYSSLSIC